MEMVGKILGNRYEILEKIGTGGMATVYKAKCDVIPDSYEQSLINSNFRCTDEKYYDVSTMKDYKVYVRPPLMGTQEA